VEPAKYEVDHRAWREAQRGCASDVLSIIGVWPVPEGETAFGTDAALPIVLPLSGGPARLGMFRRDGVTVTIVPAPDAAVRLSDGRPVLEATRFDQDVWIPTVLYAVAASALGSVKPPTDS
jgi:hypothetical protein